MTNDSVELLKNFDEAKLAALVETMYLAADADGEFSDDERQQLGSSIRDMAAGSQHQDTLETQLQGMLANAKAALDSDGRDSRLAAVKSALGDDSTCKTALALAIRVTAADGIVRTSEREFIMDLAESLGVDGDTAADLVRDITRK